MSTNTFNPAPKSQSPLTSNTRTHAKGTKKMTKTTIATLVAAALVANTAAYAGDYTYQTRYADQMGTEVTSAPNLTEGTGTADKGAVSAHRNMAKLATVAWNFAPSDTPFYFAEAIRPLSNEVKDHLESTNTDAYIVIKDGVIVNEYYADGMHPTTTHALYSVGKSVTSAIWSDELIDKLDMTAAEVLPALEGSLMGEQLVRNIVDMRVPVYWYEDSNDPNSPMVMSGSSTGWDFKSMDYDLPSFIHTLEKDPDLEVGDWHYVSGNTLAMSMMGAEVSGKHQYEVMNGFFQDLGFEHVAGVVANLHGEVSADGGHYMTLRDFAKLPYAMAHGGQIDGRHVVSDAYIEDVFSTNEAKTEAWANGPYNELMADVSHYSNQWYVVDDAIAMGIGSYGQYILFDRANDIVVAKFSTFDVGQASQMPAMDIPWLVEQVRAH